ncbi:hypothetical protein NDN08_003558 [Rhodosorus marinus]|uniref:AP3A hydrolase n=1 Tax=Rhodosorus marinus TaxID=101924 RepID=A0AAV8V2U1_9RHOD|nr:hypothetical protein NDN08_003558 [Rhodosorus marinus]
MSEGYRTEESDLLRVTEWTSREMLMPCLDGSNLVHVSRAIASVCGVPDLLFKPLECSRDKECTEEISQLIGDPKHLVLLLLDGLGVNAMELHLPPDSFLRRHVKREIRSVFPATTSAAVTSVLSGRYPSDHGLLGWTIHEKDDLLVYPLPFAVAPHYDPAKDHGVNSKDFYASLRPGTIGLVPRRKRVISAYANSDFTMALCSSLEQVPAHSFEECLSKLEESWRMEGTNPSFAYVYYNEPDRQEHKYGHEDEIVKKTIISINDKLEDFWRRNEDIKDKKIIITADHGHLVVSADNKLIIDQEADSELLECLKHRPTVEPRSPCFHVKTGCREIFAERFRKSRFSSRFALLSAQAAEDSELFGPKPLSNRARQSLGDFVALTTDRVALFQDHPDAFVGFHGGMTPSEMRIPLIVLD